MDLVGDLSFDFDGLVGGVMNGNSLLFRCRGPFLVGGELCDHQLEVSHGSVVLTISASRMGSHRVDPL